MHELVGNFSRTVPGVIIGGSTQLFTVSVGNYPQHAFATMTTTASTTSFFGVCKQSDPKEVKKAFRKTVFADVSQRLPGMPPWFDDNSNMMLIYSHQQFISFSER